MPAIPELQPILTLIAASACAVAILFIASADSAEPPGSLTVEVAKQASYRTFSTLESIYFAFDSSSLTPEARGAIRRNVMLLQIDPAAKVMLVGHTDEHGSMEYCLAIGERRARVVHHNLVTLGIDPLRITSISHGKEAPADPQHNEDAWARNRRVEFRIIR
jgi:peptidoglycan-associated lipoprotein